MFRHRIDVDFRKFEELPLERKRLAFPSLEHDFQGFPVSFGRGQPVDPVAVEFILAPASPYTEIQPAAGQHIDGRKVLSDFHRIVPGQDRDCGSKTNSVGPCGQVSE